MSKLEFKYPPTDAEIDLPPPDYHQQAYQPSPPVVQQQPVERQSSTTVVVTSGQQGMGNFKPWSTGLFGCFSDISASFGAFCCGPCYQIYLADKAGEGLLGPILCCCVYQVAFRTKTRSENHITGDVLSDLFASQCCCPCSLRQVGTEVNLQISRLQAQQQQQQGQTIIRT